MQQTDGIRDKLFTMRMSAEETERLEAVAEHYALSAAGLLRMLVKREFDALPRSEPRPTTNPKKKPKRR